MHTTISHRHIRLYFCAINIILLLSAVNSHFIQNFKFIVTDGFGHAIILFNLNSFLNLNTGMSSQVWYSSDASIKNVRKGKETF